MLKRFYWSAFVNRSHSKQATFKATCCFIQKKPTSVRTLALYLARPGGFEPPTPWFVVKWSLDRSVLLQALPCLGGMLTREGFSRRLVDIGVLGRKYSSR